MEEFFDKDYKFPDASSGYFKWEQGDNKFRVMSKPIVGWEYWVDKNGIPTEKNAAPQPGNKPVRIRMGQPVPVVAADILKHFWAMIVWNYKSNQFQILEITQKSIQSSIKSLAADEDWGTPLNYDLVVTKTGEKLETEYEVKPKPAKEVSDEIKALFKKVTINLEALFDGADPFSTNEKVEITDDELKKSGLID